MNSKILLLLPVLFGALLTLTARAGTTTIIPAGQTPICPPQASAVGFTNLVFDDEFTTATTFTTSTTATGGYNWYPFFYLPASASQVRVNTGAGTGSLTGATGYITLSGGSLATVITNPGQPGALPGSFQHGYFEARLQFNPKTSGRGNATIWPAFWSFGTSAYISPSSSAWLTTQTAENDFFEAYPEPPGFYGITTLHNWQHSSEGVTALDTGNTDNENGMISLVGSSESAQPADGAWHTLGCLWVATSATTGNVQYYLDNYLIAHQNGVTQFATGAGTSLPALETDNMVLILNGSSTQPLNVDWVRVWQAGASLSGPTGTVTQTVTGFPTMLALTTLQSPYPLPTSTSAGLPLTYSVLTGPATVAGNVLSLSGPGTVIVDATQAGSPTYAPYFGTETIAVTVPGTQTLANFPATLSLTMAQTPYTLTAATTASLTVAYTVDSGPATVAGNILTLTGTGTVVLDANQPGNYSYEPYSGTETITVTGVPQTISSFPATLQLALGQSPYTLPATTTAGLPVTYSVSTGTDAATVLNNILTLTGTGTVVLLGTQAGDAEYSPDSQQETITVVSAIPQTVANFPATLSLLTTQSPYTLPSVTSAGLPLAYLVTGPATVSGNTLTLTGTGTVELTASQAGTSTYGPYSGTEAITVTAATQSISNFPSTLSLTTSQSPHSLPATTTAGLTVTYTVKSGPAIVSGHTLTLTGAGTVSLIGSQAGNAVYGPVTQTETITVTSPPSRGRR